jgi:hypothetical protein
MTHRRFWTLTGWFWISMASVLAICGLVSLVEGDAFTDDATKCPSILVVEVRP